MEAFHSLSEKHQNKLLNAFGKRIVSFLFTYARSGKSDGFFVALQ